MVDKDDVRWAYRLFLCREPDEVYIESHQQANATRIDLRDTFIGSSEFQEHLARKGYIRFPIMRCADRFDRPFFVTNQFLQCLGGFMTGDYEAEASALVRKILKPGDIFIDVGASLGWFSFVASECVGPTGRVLAFEPHAATFEALKRTVVARGKETTISCIRSALGSTTSFAHFAAPVIPDGLGARLVAAGGERAPISSLDTYSFPKSVALLKISTNGNEEAVIVGSLTLLERDRPALLLPRKVCEQLDSLLRDIGYARSKVDSPSGFVLLERAKIATDPLVPVGYRSLISTLWSAL